MKSLKELTNTASILAKQISFEIEVITPEKAREYLATSIGNRLIKKDILTKLKAALTEGTFAVNGETIVFDSNGSLMDGHHRMEAIATSGIPAICLVVRGISRDVWTTMDSGTARSLGDVFRIEGIPNYNSVSTVVAGTNAMSLRKIGINTLGSSNKIDRDGLNRDRALKYYYANADTFQEVTRLGINVKNKLPGYFTAKEVGVISAHLILNLGHDHKKVAEFWDLVMTADGVFASLRSLFLKDMQDTKHKKLSAQARQTAIATVWNTFLQRKSAKRVSFNFEATIYFV